MKKYTKPQKIAKHLSSDKVVVAGEEKIQGSKPYPIPEDKPIILKPDPVYYGDMKIYYDVHNLSDEEMITINLLDGDFEVNGEMLDLINKVIKSLNLSSIEDLKNVSEKEFFSFFTPLINIHYNLK